LRREGTIPNQHNTRDDAERRLSAIRSYRFKGSENMLDEETVFLLGQIDIRDAALRDARAEIENLKAYQSNDVARYRSMQKTLHMLCERSAAKDEVVAAARKRFQFNNPFDELGEALARLDASIRNGGEG